jgi:hypothetical protein
MSEKRKQIIVRLRSRRFWRLRSLLALWRGDYEVRK